MSKRTLTRITTIEVTDIMNPEDVISLEQTKERKQKIAEMIKNMIGCDSVVITNIQDFETEGRKNRKKKEKK